MRPAVELSLGDDQEVTKTVSTVNAWPTSSYENGLQRIYDDDGLPEDQWEVTAAYPIHKNTEETYKDLIAKVQIGGSPAFKKVITDMLNEPQFSKLLSTSVASEAAKVPPLPCK